jgi:hypothetical protein
MTSYGSQKIVNLMERTTHDVAWIKEAAQAAIDLELSTIPPYLCALWSIEDTGTAFTTVRAVVRDEMGHLGLMCNLLKGLGVAPKIVSAVPKYPGPLPGGVRPDLTVYLSGMTKDFVEKVMMGIEKPEIPIPVTLKLAETFPSIGKFYEAIANALSAQKPPLSAAGQLSSAFGVHPLTTIDEALKAIDHIRGQGEGTTTTATFEGQLAHFYRFEEIFIGKKLVETAPGKLTKTNIDVPFPRTLPMGKVPFGGWPNRDPDGKGTLLAFNNLYRSVLQDLEAAWDTGGASALGHAIATMTSMEDPAKTLMNVKQGTGTENYGPDFLI